MEQLICRVGILILGFSFILLASVVQVQVFAQEQQQPQFSPPPPPSPPPPSPPPPPPPVSPPPPPPPLLSPPPPSLVASPPPPPWTAPPPPSLQSPPPPPPSPHRAGRLPGHIPRNAFNPNSDRRNTRTKQHGLNSGKKIGFLFIGVAVVLQIFVVGILIFQRRQMLKVKDRYENVE